MTSYPPPGQYPPPPPDRSGFPQEHPAYPQAPLAYSPPPPFAAAPPIDAPPASWLIPLAALLAVIGVFTPWFNADGTYQGREILKSGGGLYSFKDGKIGLLAPIVLVVIAVSVVGLLRGKARGRFAGGPDPVRSAAKFSIGAGVASGVCVLIAWFLVPWQYHFNVADTTYSWSKLESHGVSLSRGPQLGYFLTIAAAVVAVAGGLLMLVTAKPVPAPTPALPYGPPPGAATPYPVQPAFGTGFPPPPDYPLPASYPPPASYPAPSLEKPPSS